MSELKNKIAARVAKELHDGDVVNLGIGLPTFVANHLPEGVSVILQSENGFIGLGPKPEPDKVDPYITNAGGNPVTILKHGAFFDSATSFGIIRGGHVDVTVLGALEVDEKGNLANWIIPNKKVPGMGGAMDLVVGTKKVIIAMEHTNNGRHKILKQCSLPLTAVNCVDLIVTEKGVLEVTTAGLRLIELAPDCTLDEFTAATGADFTTADDVGKKVNGD